jgi:hypothetical protein
MIVAATWTMAANGDPDIPASPEKKESEADRTREKEPKAADETEMLIQRAKENLKRDSKSSTPLIDSEVASQDVKDAYAAYLKSWYENEKWEVDHRRWIYNWQYIAAIIVFVISMCVVVVGVVMSWMQFIASQTAVKNRAEALSAVGKAYQEAAKSAGSEPKPEVLSAMNESLKEATNTIKLSSTGVEVATPVVGVIILTLSLAFFYMYLKFVFPIQ